MMLYYKKVNAQDELGDNNDGLSFGLYWYDNQECENFLDAQWFESEQQRDDFINRNKMNKVISPAL